MKCRGIHILTGEHILKSLTIVLTAILFQMNASAQDRMPPIPKGEMTEAQKKAEAELVSGPRGALLRFQNTIGPKLTEFVVLLTARQWTQQYAFDAHVPNALKAGVKQE